MVNPNINKNIRIAKFIAKSGLCSRREAERKIFAGNVSVDGKIIDSPALNISIDSIVIVDGNKITFNNDTVIFLYHKPKGLIVSKNDEKNRLTIFDDLTESFRGLFSVGRLDKESSGLLLLTNNGDVSRHLELPRNNFQRKYQIVINGKLSEEQLKMIKKGVRIGEFFYKPIKIFPKKTNKKISVYELFLSEGKNREIRKIIKYFKLNVLDLLRTDYGPYNIGKLKPSEFIQGNLGLINFN
ncbi:MAG: pseudouridine synthase [Chloroflexota bacterium]|nr:pseudouridine synthase [Chloroflexota bacterium]